MTSKQPKQTRAERRESRASEAVEGAYSVDAMAAGADSWTGHSVVWAGTADEAKQRIAAAGLRRKQIERQWTPSRPPPDGLPTGLGSDDSGWYRSRRDDDGWTEWKALDEAYRLPSQALAAVDPSLR